MSESRGPETAPRSGGDYRDLGVLSDDVRIRLRSGAVLARLPAVRRTGRRNFPSSSNPSANVWPNRYMHRGLRACLRAGGLDSARPRRRASHLVGISWREMRY